MRLSELMELRKSPNKNVTSFASNLTNIDEDFKMVESTYISP